MTKQAGVIGVTPEGQYLQEFSELGHLGTHTKYSLTNDINKATLFYVLPKQTTYQVTGVVAWSKRIIRIGEVGHET